MSRRTADNRQRELTLSARFNEREAEAIRQMADHAGASVAAVIPGAVLNAPIPRAARRPTLNDKMVARVLGELGRIADILRAAAVARPIRRTRMLPPRSATSRRRARSLSGHGREPCPERQPARRRQQSGYPPHERVRQRTSRPNVWLQSLLGRRTPKAWHRGSMYEPSTHTNNELRAPDTAELRGHNVQ